MEMKKDNSIRVKETVANIIAKDIKFLDCILLIRLDNKVYLTYKDGLIVRDIVGIDTLSKDCDTLYFKFHDLDTVLPKIIRNGFKVAIMDSLA